YRLKVVHLQIPPLRDRPEDIPVLARHFLSEFARRFGTGPLHVTPQLLDRLNQYRWPGNVRELENALESLVALSQGSELDLSLLPETRPVASEIAPSESVPEAPPHPATATRLELKDRMDAYERGQIVTA